jgi:thiol-disulfide isomerase/thioredoxin
MNSKIKPLLIAISFIVSFFSSNAQTGYHIEIEVGGFEGNEMYLAYYMAGSQYVKDTVSESGDRFIFQGEEHLDPGIYLVVMPPENQFFQVMINSGDQNFKMKTSFDSLNQAMEVSGSDDNEIFYKYLNFLNLKRPIAEELRKRLESTKSENEQIAIQTEFEQVNQEVSAYQQSIISAFPNSLTALLIRANTDVQIPEFEGTGDETQLQKYAYYKQHYFDNINFRDPRTVRTPFIQSRIDHYLDKVTVQLPDSISRSIDHILNKFDPESEGFQYYLVQFLNEFAKSKIVGMDAVYVHLVDNYYARGYAPWTEEEQLRKIIKNANTLRPILIGKTAPNIELTNKEGVKVDLHSIEAEYLVLFFWDPDCGHCKTAIPLMLEFYNDYNPKGVEIVAVCSEYGDKDIKKCWDSIEERKMGRWLNLVDPYLKSRFKQIYDIRTTPQIFILDRDKEIIVKRIGAEQLRETLDHFIERGS